MNKKILITLISMALLNGCDKSDSDTEQIYPGEYQIHLETLPRQNEFRITDVSKEYDPCYDFYNYTNGKWIKQTTIPNDRASWGTNEILEERSLNIQHQLVQQLSSIKNKNDVERILNDIWISGMDEDAINNSRFPILDEDLVKISKINKLDDLIEFINTTTSRGDTFLFEVKAEPDFNNSDYNLAYIMPTGIGLPDKTYYFDKNHKDIIESYKTHIAKVLELSGVSQDESISAADKILKLETRLAKVLYTQEELSRNIELQYNPVTIQDANALTDNFNWNVFFKEQGIIKPKIFSLVNPEYFKELNKLFKDADINIWRLYFRYHILDNASLYISDSYSDEHYDFYERKLNGQNKKEPRWKMVLNSINQYTGEALGQIYVKASFSSENKYNVTDMVYNLKSSLKEHIQNLDWMSERTKHEAIVKLNAIVLKIGFPDKWKDWSGLRTNENDYLFNIRNAIKYNYVHNIEKIGEKVDRNEWGITPQTVNAGYDPQGNEVIFPAAILQPPYYDADADDALNYGGIGAVIGHELTHAFDDQGSRFGPNGNIKNWWLEKDKLEFDMLTSKVEKEFLNYTINGKKINSRLTLGENIADLGGLAIAYDAMKKATPDNRVLKIPEYNRDQLFFLNWATLWRSKMTLEKENYLIINDPHSPPSIRAVAAPSNLASFSTAFQCKNGTPMNPSNKLSIW
ncbi:M13 family metallopeptidase [Klebsiella pneumoniae]